MKAKIKSKTRGENAQVGVASSGKQWVWCYCGNEHPIEGGNNRCFGKTNDFTGIEASRLIITAASCGWLMHMK